MNKYVEFLRIPQWYKNLVVFLALFFTTNLFNFELLSKTIMGFFSLCLVSSSYYILNDIIDRDEDRQHPEKKKRPIASGEINVGVGLTVSIVLLVCSIALAYFLKPAFALFPAILFISSAVYTLYFKRIAILDVHLIALNFLLKAVSGAVLIDVPSSPWLVTTVFFMALFLAVGKRRSELHLLNEGAVKHKRVYEVYNDRLLSMMLMVIVTVLLFTYSLYTFQVHQKPYPYMMITIPFATFMVFRYLYFVSIDHEIAGKTQLVFRDRQMVLALILWLATSYMVMSFLNS